MGMRPKTKAECDKKILSAQKQVNYYQQYLATMRASYGTNSASANAAKISLAKAKGDLAELKALRKTLK